MSELTSLEDQKLAHARAVCRWLGHSIEFEARGLSFEDLVDQEMRAIRERRARLAERLYGKSLPDVEVSVPARSTNDAEKSVAEIQSTAPEPTQPEPPKKRSRADNLRLAILDAWRKGFPVNSPGSALFEHLVTHDDTGYIRGRDGNDLKWENSSGEITTTTKKAVINRLPRYREHFLKHG